MHGGEVHRAAEGERRQDRQLVRRVHAVDVEGGIGLGIAEALRVGERLGEFPPALAHLRQDVVAGAVQDAGDALEAVGRQPLAQRLDDRDAAGDRRLEGQRHALHLRRTGEGGAMDGEQRLVRRHHRLAGGQRGLDRGAGRALGAADGLDHHVHRRVMRQRDRVVVPAQPVQRDAAVARAVARRHGGHGDGTAGAGRDQLGIGAQDLQRARADGAETGQGDGKGTGQARTSSAEVSVEGPPSPEPGAGPPLSAARKERMPRRAWRMR